MRVAAEENEARVVDRQINDLVSYKDALVSNSSQLQGKQYPLHSRKRERSRTPSCSPPCSPTPSPSRSSVLGAERRRTTVRGGKGKDRRGSFSRSPSPDRRSCAARTPDRTIPGLVYGDDRRGSLQSRGREFTPRRSPSRRPSPGSPPRFPSWQVASRRRRRDRR